MIRDTSYKAKEFNLHGLKGISDETLEMHFKLYEGYVNETNKLNEKIYEFLADGKVDQEEVPAYSELILQMVVSRITGLRCMRSAMFQASHLFW
jgi:superoxide dismutase